MNDNEIVQILQKANEAIETLQGAYEVMSALADVRKEEIESLQAQLEQKTNEAEGMRSNWYKCIENLKESQRREQDARNELCLKCGRYHEAHSGACYGCRWKED